jgi:UDP-N-acetylglucosamine enolpyruvyl transferase
MLACRRLLAHEGTPARSWAPSRWSSRIEVDTIGKKSRTPHGRTKCLKGKAAMAADVKAGARVVLSVVEKEGKKSVSEVLMAEAGEPDQHGRQH